MSLTVSIVVPVYGVERFIERCAVSLFEQTYGNIEYVFVNDCTKDKSIQILEKVLMRYPLRKESSIIVDHRVNRGLAAARNTGVENCTGDFIFHVDPDDYLEPNSVELLVKHQLTSEADIVTGMAVQHNSDRIIPLHHPHYGTKEEMVLDMMQPTINHTIWGRLIKKSLYDDYHIKAEEGVNCGEDCWVMTQLAYYCASFSFLDEVVYNYDCTRVDSYMANKTEEVNRKRINDDITTANLIIGFFKDKEAVYYDEANRVAVKYIEKNLKRAATACNSEFFDEMLTKLKSFDRIYWDTIGWDKSYKRIVSQDIHACRAALLSKRLCNRILSHIQL